MTRSSGKKMLNRLMAPGKFFFNYHVTHFCIRMHTGLLTRMRGFIL